MKTANTYLATWFALMASALAGNTIKIVNHCPYDIWFWVVGPPSSNLPGLDHDRHLVPANHGSKIHTILDTSTLPGGLSLKFRDLPRYFTAPAGIIQIEYHLDPSQQHLWYDLSLIDCDVNQPPRSPTYCPLIKGGISAAIAGTTCPAARCDAQGCENAYLRPGGFPEEPSLRCAAGRELLVETCTLAVGPRTFDWETEGKPRGLLVSKDGRCGGGELGFTCEGSGFGACCSAFGFCGVTMEHCDARCQTKFGKCPGEVVADVDAGAETHE